MTEPGAGLGLAELLCEFGSCMAADCLSMALWKSFSWSFDSENIRNLRSA